MRSMNGMPKRTKKFGSSASVGSSGTGLSGAGDIRKRLRRFVALADDETLEKLWDALTPEQQTQASIPRRNARGKRRENDEAFVHDLGLDETEPASAPAHGGAGGGAGGGGASKRDETSDVDDSDVESIITEDDRVLELEDAEPYFTVAVEGKDVMVFTRDVEEYKAHSAWSLKTDVDDSTVPDKRLGTWVDAEGKPTLNEEGGRIKAPPNVKTTKPIKMK